MVRVKRGVTHHARHKKVLEQTKGHSGGRHRLYKTAKESLVHALMYQYRDRRTRKRDFRKLWIQRINAAARLSGISYSRLIDALKSGDIEVNRKMLAELAVNDPASFASLVEGAKVAATAAADLQPV
ncbi:MAG: 50S ribosomal protein L20 [Chloroflexi bacterium]|nr:50S ribosomal protein L20 [Chloroflexota bacterium]